MSFPKYPEYTDSGEGMFGELPAHWRSVRLKNVLEQPITDGPHTTPIFISEGVPFLSVDAIQDGELRFDTCRYVSEADHSEFRRKAAPRRDDLLMGKAASTGKIARVKVDCEFSIWSPLALIRVAPTSAASSYVEYCLKSPPAQAQIDNYCTSNTQKNISMDDIPKIVLPLPPLQEQLTIAAFLDRETAKIDRLVAEQRRLIELLKEKRQAVISRVVTKGLNPNVTTKRSGIEWLGDVPQHWEILRVKTVSTFITSGPRGWSERISEDGAIFVQSGDLNELLEVEFAGCKRVQVDSDAEADRTRLSDGDVVVCVTGAKTGNVAVCPSVPERAYVNQHLCLVRPRPTILPHFLGILLKSEVGRTYFQLSQYGLKQGLSLEDVQCAPVILPTLDEQRTIVRYVGSETGRFETLTTEAHRAIDLLQERRAALISATVTGKIDVRDAVAGKHEEAEAA